MGEDDELYVAMDIVPHKARFKKIDLVEYGKLFDNYKNNNISDSVQFDMEQIHRHRNDWYLNHRIRESILSQFKNKQFPLKALCDFCINFNQTELLEFICMQELIETDFWCRDYFKCIVFISLKKAAHCTKLAAINVMASYMIPDRISKKEALSVITGWDSKLCREMVNEGMNN